jgi:DNA replication protein DnaC
MLIAYNRYAESNIQIEYWGLSMDDFVGSNELKKVYARLTENLPKVYSDGMSLCLAGSHGIGKTMTVSCILKRACEKNYSCLYTTLNDIVNTLIEAPYDDKYLIRKELMGVDLLVIDEMDSKYITDGASDLFARSVEPILRGRSQNKMPLFICSNSPNPTQAFKGSIKESIDSIFNRIKIISVLDKDFRKNQK